MPTIRPASSDDAVFLRTMGVLAAGWRSGAPDEQAIAADPHFGRYIDRWGREGDAGVVALEDGRPVGAAWYRFFSADEPGYGFLDRETPEVSIAVDPAFRGRGVGTALLDALCERAQRDGLSALSLSVERDNPALRIYERRGFVEVGGTADAATMRIDLRRGSDR